MTVEHAAQLIELGRPREALTALDGAGDDATTGRALCLRALAHLRLREPKEAALAAGRARAAEPQHEWGYRLGAIAALHRSDARSARELAQEAVRKAPWEPLTHSVLVSVLLATDELALAQVHAEEMLRLAPDRADAHETIGRVHLAWGRLEDAERSLRRALAIDPQDSECMALLATTLERRGQRAAAHELRLTALRSDPQNERRQQDVLRRRGAATAGGFFALGKLGVLGKVFAVSGLLHSGELFSSADGLTTLGVLLAVYLGCFAVSRVRRARHGRSLPPLVWEGLAPHRRNSDLAWLACLAALFLVGGTAATLRSGSVTAAVFALLGAAVLTGCWRLRQGSARQLRLRDLRRQVRWLPLVGVQRLRRPARSRPDAGAAPLEPPPVEARVARALGGLLLNLVGWSVLLAALPPWAGLPSALLLTALLGAGLDGLVIRHHGMPCVVCLDGSTRRAGRVRLAARALLRLLLLPLLLVQGLIGYRGPRRLVHDVLTGTTVTGLRPAASALGGAA